MPQATSTEQLPRALLRTSHSALNTFLQCPEKFRQEKILGRKTIPGWWNAGGRAVHSLTEEWDRLHIADRNPVPDGPEGFPWEKGFTQVFDVEVFEEEEKSSTSRTEWRAAGEGSARRLTEDEAFWRANGPTYAKNWALWRQAHPEWQIWTTPDGTPAIELEFDVEFGGVATKAFVDRILINEREELAVVDLKSGSGSQDLLDQLLLYAGCVEKRYGVLPQLGSFFDCRKGRMVRMEAMDPELVWGIEERVRISIDQARAGEYLARPGEQCAFRCGFAEHCTDAKRLTSFWRSKAGI